MSYSDPLRVLCVAGEASGDLLLSKALRALKVAMNAQGRPLHIVGLGGPLSIEEGLELVVDPRTLAAQGLVEAIGALWATIRAYQTLKKILLSADVLICVDFPEVNVRLIQWAHRLQIPRLYISPPQAWAWRPWRARTLRGIEGIYCLFPFEQKWYQSRGVNAALLGHPLQDITQAVRDQRTMQIKSLRALDANAIVPRKIALFPGSRVSAVQRSLPRLIEGILEYSSRNPTLSIELYIVRSPWISNELIQNIMMQQRVALESGSIYWMMHTSEDILVEAEVALCHVGTVSLEFALTGCALLTIAPLHPVSAFFARHLVQVNHVALPNLLLKE